LFPSFSALLVGSSSACVQPAHTTVKVRPSKTKCITPYFIYINKFLFITQELLNVNILCQEVKKQYRNNYYTLYWKWELLTSTTKVIFHLHERYFALHKIEEGDFFRKIVNKGGKGMTINRRNYSILAGDFAKVRAFFQKNYHYSNGFWPSAAWEYAHSIQWFDYHSHHRIGLWEDEEGKIVGVATYELELGELYIFVSKGYEYLKSDMLNYGEKNLYTINSDGRCELRVEAYSFEPTFQELLVSHGYTKEYDVEITIYDYVKGLPDVKISDGFKIITLDEVDDYQKTVDTIWQGFDHKGAGDLNAFLLTMNAPHFRKDLTFLVEAENGDYCCYASVWLDETHKCAYLEPLSTVPKYRRKGLAKALINEAINQTHKLGATYMVGGSNEFYFDLGFESVYQTEWYKKVW